MRALKRSLLLLLALAVLSPPVKAQLVDLNDTRTVEQKWTRAMTFAQFGFSAVIASGKEAGKTPEELGTWLGKWSAPTWGSPGDLTLPEFVWWYHRNFNVEPGLEFELLSESESEIRGRMNFPSAAFFGEDQLVLGVTLEEYRTMWLTAYEALADYMGFEMTHEVDGDHINFTVKVR